MIQNHEVLRHAEEYADAVAAHRLEHLYGTSKSYTRALAQERDEASARLQAAIQQLLIENRAQSALLRQAKRTFDSLEGMDDGAPEWVDVKLINGAIGQHLENGQ